MNRDELDVLVDTWHDSDTKVSLHEYLGMSSEEYALWTEFDILPGEPIPMKTFLELRSDAYRWANDADNYLTENRRYKAAIEELRTLSNYQEIDADYIHDILDRNNI